MVSRSGETRILRREGACRRARRHRLSLQRIAEEDLPPRITRLKGDADGASGIASPSRVEDAGDGGVVVVPVARGASKKDQKLLAGDDGLLRPEEHAPRRQVHDARSEERVV